MKLIVVFRAGAELPAESEPFAYLPGRHKLERGFHASVHAVVTAAG